MSRGVWGMRRSRTSLLQKSLQSDETLVARGAHRSPSWPAVHPTETSIARGWPAGHSYELPLHQAHARGRTKHTQPWHRRNRPTSAVNAAHDMRRREGAASPTSAAALENEVVPRAPIASALRADRARSAAAFISCVYNVVGAVLLCRLIVSPPVLPGPLTWLKMWRSAARVGEIGCDEAWRSVQDAHGAGGPRGPAWCSVRGRQRGEWSHEAPACRGTARCE